MSLLPPEPLGDQTLPSWVVLDTAFGGAFQFLTTWRQWQNSAQRPKLLHYVALLEELDVPDWFELPEHYDHDPTLKKLANQLADQCDGAQPGFQRILLDSGQVSLTLCIGAMSALLGEIRMQADIVWLDVFQDQWDTPTLKSLIRSCKRGTLLHLSDYEDTLLERLQQQGFWAHSEQNPLQQLYNPTWEIKTSRQTHLALAHAPACCAIIGAGLSGACVAQALALRGWQVTVYDQHDVPAKEASGVPAGVVAPYLSADNSPRSQLSHIGTRLMLQHAKRFLQQGTDWDGCGVQEHRFHQQDRMKPVWHTHAGWIKVGALVRAWLQQSGVSFVGNADISAINDTQNEWQLLGTEGHHHGCADIVILANAKGSAKLSGLEGLQVIQGTMSYGNHADCESDLSDWPHHPVNGHGNFIPAVPGNHGVQWIAGATFHTDAAFINGGIASVQSQHQFNLTRLQTLLPSVARDVKPVFDRQAVQSWSSSRCVTPDRMPWVGAITPKLWLNVGMGARGLSFAALCAELLVAQLCGEPWPIAHQLARGLDVKRVLNTA